MSKSVVLSLFEGFGIEIEYALVERETLDVAPIADRLLESISGSEQPESEIELGDIALSNELALHVAELKTNGPASTLVGAGQKFQEQVSFLNEKLAAFEAQLLPTAMHPWMDPANEFWIWPHEYNEVYRSYDRVFDCAGHAWANVQSTHLNLPFANDAEFGRLHAAVRLVLPLVPALAASSPIVDGIRSDFLDARLDFYSGHTARVPSIAGVIIPEPLFSIDEYRQRLLRQLYADISLYDAYGTLQHEWLNARGAIARFDRMALELRLTDTQECPSADVAVAGAIAAAVQWLVEEVACDGKRQRSWGHKELAALLKALVRDADLGVIDNRKYLESFGFPEKGPARAGELWQHIIEAAPASQLIDAESMRALNVIVSQGVLSRRILAALGDDQTHEHIHAVYQRLADCLAQGRSFVP